MRRPPNALAALLIATASACWPTSSGRPAAQFDVAVTTNLSFAPSELDLPQGSTVRWTNHDSTGHTVTSGTPDRPTRVFSELLGPADSFSFTFGQTGTFAYFCSIHHAMRGTVTVK